MRISDWSSDVCSSDLFRAARRQDQRRLATDSCACAGDNRALSVEIDHSLISLFRNKVFPARRIRFLQAVPPSSSREIALTIKSGRWDLLGKNRAASASIRAQDRKSTRLNSSH